MGETQRAVVGDDTVDTPVMQPADETAFEMPEKFVNEDGSVDTEALGRSYVELERRSSVGGEPTEETPEGGEEQNELTIEEGETPPGMEGLPFSDDELSGWTEEFQKDGKLSEQSYADLAKKGFPRMLVDTWLDGQMARAQQRDAGGVSIVGGQENYQEMSDWARGALSQAEKDAYNKAINGSDGDRDAAIRGLYARYQQQAPPSRRIGGQTPQKPSVKPFSSTAEMTAAMKDPRYHKDPAYVQHVQERVAAMS